jgi:hypothetical protein
MQNSSVRSFYPLLATQSDRKPCGSVSFGAFRSEQLCNSEEKSQVAENRLNKPEIIVLTENSRKGYAGFVPKSSTKRIPAKVAFILSDEEKRLILAVQGKLGINKATDVLRMGLKRLAEGVKVAV